MTDPPPTVRTVLVKLRHRLDQGKPAALTGDEARFLVDLLARLDVDETAP